MYIFCFIVVSLASESPFLQYAQSTTHTHPTEIHMYACGF